MQCKLSCFSTFPFRAICSILLSYTYLSARYVRVRGRETAFVYYFKDMANERRFMREAIDLPIGPLRLRWGKRARWFPSGNLSHGWLGGTEDPKVRRSPVPQGNLNEIQPSTLDILTLNQDVGKQDNDDLRASSVVVVRTHLRRLGMETWLQRT